MVCIKTGSGVLEEKAKGILWLLKGGGWEEVERGLKGLWGMEPRLWEVGSPWIGVTFPPCGSPALQHPYSVAKPVSKPSVPSLELQRLFFFFSLSVAQTLLFLLLYRQTTQTASLRGRGAHLE